MCWLRTSPSYNVFKTPFKPAASAFSSGAKGNMFGIISFRRKFEFSFIIWAYSHQYSFLKVVKNYSYNPAGAQRQNDVKMLKRPSSNVLFRRVVCWLESVWVCSISTKDSFFLSIFSYVRTWYFLINWFGTNMPKMWLRLIPRETRINAMRWMSHWYNHKWTWFWQCNSLQR